MGVKDQMKLIEANAYDSSHAESTSFKLFWIKTDAIRYAKMCRIFFFVLWTSTPGGFPLRRTLGRPRPAFC